MKKQVIAIDLGASSGRVMQGIYENERILLRELHRFVNEPVMENGTMYWDFPGLLKEIKTGLKIAAADGAINSLSVDTWGVDFGLLDEHGSLLEHPVHYRDKRTRGMLKEVGRQIPGDELYQITGNQLMEINTLYQLYYLSRQRPDLLKQAKTLLLMPDLFHYMLSGTISCEYSIASTTQMMDLETKTWSAGLLERLHLPGELLPPIVPCGTRIGTLTAALQQELKTGPAAVIASAGHDTQCAMAAIPAMDEAFIFISCGTWSLCGTELDRPQVSPESMHYNITNEGGACGKISFLKNIIGTWLIQESRRAWEREGQCFSYGELEQLAKRAPAFTCLIDPDDPEFMSAGNMPERIRSYARRTGQTVPADEGAIVRCINESLALKFRQAINEISACTGVEYKVIHLVGGGSQSALLCQMTANACRCPVVAGPVEATVFGNVGIQLMTLGEIESLKDLRKIIASSVDLTVYQPVDSALWDQAFQLGRNKLWK